MFSFWTAVLLAVSLNVHCLSSVYAFDPNSLRVLGPQAVNLWKLEQSRRPSSAGLLVQESDNTRLQDDQYISGPHWFRQPLDHFDKGNNHTFLQRYWVNSYFYKPGKDRAPAPVIVLDGGETSGEVRCSGLCLQRNGCCNCLRRTDFRSSGQALRPFWRRLLGELRLYWSIGTTVRVLT